MSKKETTEVATVSASERAVITPEQNFALGALFSPEDEGYQKRSFPRISFRSQDKTEETGVGKSKQITIVEAAGTFFTENATEELDENNKPIWEKNEVGESIELIIIGARKQLRMYNEKTEKFTSSPIYDHDDEIIPIFCDKQEIDRGTPAQLQAKYMTKTTSKGKPKSALEEERVLYVVHNNATYSMNVRGSSMYSYLSYKRAVSNPAKYITVITSESMEKGTIKWNQMKFTALRPCDQETLDRVVVTINELIGGIAAEKAFFNKDKEVPEEVKANEEEFDAWTGAKGTN